MLNFVDDVTRECLAAIPDTAISGVVSGGDLNDLIGRRGRPDMIVYDHGTEFTLRRPCLVEGSSRRVALHRTGQVDADGCCRIALSAHHANFSTTFDLPGRSAIGSRCCVGSFRLFYSGLFFGTFGGLL